VISEHNFQSSTRGSKRLYLAGLLALIIGALLLIPGNSTRAVETGGPWTGALILTQLPRNSAFEKMGALAGGTLRQPYGDGARIVLVRAGSKPALLTPGFHSASDPNISFDGQKMLFAGKRRANDRWNIFEMHLDGSQLRQITRDLGDCRNPIYQGTLFTLDSKEPWFQVSFVSRQGKDLNEYGALPAESLYSCKLDGSEVRRLSFNLSSDMDPFMLPDGRMVYAAWQLSTLNRGPFGRVGLFAINIDGTDNGIFAADEGLRVKHMPAVTTSRLVVFVEADKVGWDGAGRLASVSLRRNLHSHRPITAEADGLFHSPSPLPNGHILVSRRDGSSQKSHAVYRMDPETGKRELLFDDPKYHNIQAQAVTGRPLPDGRSSVVLETESMGRIYCLNLFISDVPEEQWVKPGSPLRLRVLEGIGRDQTKQLPAAAAEGSHDDFGPWSGTQGIVPSVQKRFLGEIPVERDGSFNVQVPANTAIQMQLVDSHGIALRTSHWMWVKNNESRGCIGCHEDNELTPPNRFVDAIGRPSTPLTLPPAKRRTVDFRRDVMPIVATKCATSDCHGSPAASLQLDAALQPGDKSGPGRYFNRSYLNLLAGTRSGKGKFVHPGSARTSPLIWHLFGRNTSQPWDAKEDTTRTPKLMRPDHAHTLTAEEKRTFVEWIDLGALWDGIPDDHAITMTQAQTAASGGTR
jgi:hypothetical protein